VIDLPDDFRDLLVELADAGAAFVLVGQDLADVAALARLSSPPA
jgi:hypothetical protein